MARTDGSRRTGTAVRDRTHVTGAVQVSPVAGRRPVPQGLFSGGTPTRVGVTVALRLSSRTRVREFWQDGPVSHRRILGRRAETVCLSESPASHGSPG